MPRKQAVGRRQRPASLIPSLLHSLIRGGVFHARVCSYPSCLLPSVAEDTHTHTHILQSAAGWGFPARPEQGYAT